MVDFSRYLQEFTRYSTVGLLAYAAYTVYMCPCNIIPACHWMEFHGAILMAVVAVNANIVTQLALQAPLSEDEEDSNDSVTSEEHSDDDASEEKAAGVGGDVNGSS